MVVPFKANVGLSRISSKTDSTQANFTQSVRQSMAGIIAEYRRWIEHMNVQSADVLVEALTPTFELSQELVPVATGALKESGYVEKRTIGGVSSVEIGYARGGNPDYAVIVHEDPDMQHKPPTQFKYLQVPIEQDFDNVKERVIAGLKAISGV